MTHRDVIRQFFSELDAIGVPEDYSLFNAHRYPFPLDPETRLVASLAALGPADWVEMAALRRALAWDAGTLLTTAFRFSTMAVREERAELTLLAMWLISLDDDVLDPRDVMKVALTIIHAHQRLKQSNLLDLSSVLEHCTHQRQKHLERWIQGYKECQPELSSLRVRLIDSGANSCYAYGDGPL